MPVTGWADQAVITNGKSQAVREFGGLDSRKHRCTSPRENVVGAPLDSGRGAYGKVPVQTRQELARLLGRQRFANLGLHRAYRGPS